MYNAREINDDQMPVLQHPLLYLSGYKEQENFLVTKQLISSIIHIES